MLQRFVTFSDLTYVFLWSGWKTSSPGTPPLNGVGIFFINIPAYCLQNFFFGEAEAPFLHQFKTLQLFLFMEEDSSWSTHRLAFYPSQSLQMFKLDSLGIL